MQINIVSKSFTDWISELEKDNFDMAMETHGSGPGDPDVMYVLYDSSQQPPAGLDVLNVVDKSLDKALEAGRTTLNLKKAKADYFKAQFRLLLHTPNYDIYAVH